MAIISTFLCWSNTRTGSAVCGYYTLVISVVCLAFYMLRYIALDEIKDSIELKGIVYAGFVLYSFLIGVSLVLLPGVYMDRKFLLLPWIYVLVITVLYETGAIALITTVHLEQDHTLSPWEIVAVVFYCLRLVANCYCFACVVSQYQELSEGRGTYEFLFKPRRRQMARGVPVSELEEYHPPYGAALPPYSKVNLYKEYCPPNYENLAMEGETGRWDLLGSPQYGLSLIGAVGRGGGGASDGSGLRGAMSTSCLAEVHVSTPPPGFEHVEIYGEDGDYDSISSSFSDPSPSNIIRVESNSHHHSHHHHHHQYSLQPIDSHDNSDEGQHFTAQDQDRNHRRHHHHHPRPQHHRHRSLPETQHGSQYGFNPSSDSNNSNNHNGRIESIHRQHHRHRSVECKPNASSTPIDFTTRRLPDYHDLHLTRPPYCPNLTSTPTNPCQSTTNNTMPGSLASQDKEPITITMTESSGSFLTFSQTDFRTPTPKSSPALSVHSCHRLNNNNNNNSTTTTSGSRSPPSSPPIHKRTYITWI